ncbi:amino acid racemase [Acuticoccus sp. M5D2P5]|uniref:aspartate/glutamate racemase family protein n=1 Tax=Acuticoccus kalidii TaxID=2910977 RepID=UPI001F3CC821|nr:amino acid racemase [Acuticoccus kalidii]
MAVIGIIGGMGPEATVLFMSRIIERTPAEDDADHIPMVVDNNTRIPSRIAHLIEKRGVDPEPTLVGIARKLERYGATLLAMPCNTAHSYADAIKAAIALPFLDMVELTVEAVTRANPATRRVGLLASPAVEITGIYDRAFAAAGIDVLYPDDRAALLGAIKAIKAGARDDRALGPLAAGYRELTDRGADAAIVACSEFSLLSDALTGPLPVLDSVTVLAEAAIALAMAQDAP